VLHTLFFPHFFPVSPFGGDGSPAGMMASAFAVAGRTHFRRIKYAKQCKLSPGQQNNNSSNNNRTQNKNFPWPKN